MSGPLLACPECGCHMIIKNLVADVWQCFKCKFTSKTKETFTKKLVRVPKLLNLNCAASISRINQNMKKAIMVMEK